MLKITYKVKSTYSLKENDDGHLMARTMKHLSRSTIRGALLATAFKYKGREWTTEHIYEIKNAGIYPQKPNNYSVQKEKRALLTANAIQNGINKDKKKKEPFIPVDKDDVDSYTTVGIREFLYTDTLTFYIDEIIEDVTELLSNITRLGNSESLVELQSIERINKLENVLIPTSSKETKGLNDELAIVEGFDYDQEYIYDSDWHNNTELQHVDAYNEKYGRNTVRFRCKVMDIEL